MAAKYYTLAELKQLALDSANVIGATTYVPADVESAYNIAVGFCGFENPTSSDIDYTLKQRYLIQAMELHFLKDVQKRYLLKFDIGDLRMGQVSREVREMIRDLEDSLASARNSPVTAGIFMNASDYFGKVVAKAGLTDDAVGQNIDPEEL